MKTRSSGRRAVLMTAAVASVVVVGIASARSGRADNVPYRPRTPDAVVERLPFGRAAVSEIDRLRALAAAAPHDPERAAAVAERCIAESRKTGDPRFLGQARAALAAFWSDRAAPPRIVLLRATIEQSLHDFPAALADLDDLTRASPHDPQVWLTRGVVLYVVGRYDEARASCEKLRAPETALAYLVCRSTIDSVTGRAKPAYDALAAWLARDERDESASAAERGWALSSLGEIAIRAGDDAAAERHFRAALEADPDDRYTRAALADLLLDRGRAAEAADVVGGRTDDDGLLLRLALAKARLGASDAAATVETLGARHDASIARGDGVHRREQARFELDLRHDPKRALALALANFDVQREPADVRLVFEAAHAADRPEAARAALAFFDASGSEEPRLRALAARVRR